MRRVTAIAIRSCSNDGAPQLVSRTLNLLDVFFSQCCRIIVRRWKGEAFEDELSANVSPNSQAHTTLHFFVIIRIGRRIANDNLAGQGQGGPYS